MASPRPGIPRPSRNIVLLPRATLTKTRHAHACFRRACRHGLRGTPRAHCGQHDLRRQLARARHDDVGQMRSLSRLWAGHHRRTGALARGERRIGARHACRQGRGHDAPPRQHDDGLRPLGGGLGERQLDGAIGSRPVRRRVASPAKGLRPAGWRERDALAARRIEGVTPQPPAAGSRRRSPRPSAAGRGRAPYPPAWPHSLRP